MTFTVTWSLTAIQLLVRISAVATDPAAVQRAAALIDRVLRRIPEDVGESRSGNARVWYQDVLGVYYRVDTAAMTVHVLLVGPARRR